MKKVIVTTTINPITKAIQRFQQMKDWDIVVVGDLKTPKDYHLEKGIYISPEMQDKYDHELSELIGWNCIQRRNFGLLWAKDMDADIIAVIDDDNIPLDNWGQNLFLNEPINVKYYQSDLVFDPIGATNYPNLWHRGFPLDQLKNRKYNKYISKTIVPDVQADFWNGDPDIDAICRMEHAPECQFEQVYFPMASSSYSPFNSQNTFISKNYLKDYFLFPHIGRMDDIWASYYLQAKGAQVVYGKPSVYQDRNEHDLIEDMKKEYLGYEQNSNLLKSLKIDPENIKKFLPKKSWDAFMRYKLHFYE